ncbi:MAG: sterol desaturase family protein [Cellvibrionaceae bacterium]
MAFMKHQGFFNTWVPRLAFPVTMAAGLSTTFWLMSQGKSPEIAALISVLVFGFLWIPLLEKALPYRAEWSGSDGDLKPDIIHLIINGIIPKLWTPIQVASLVAITHWASEQYGSNRWPHDWPLLLQLALMLLIAEFGRYWIHRAAHTVPWLWRLHAVHHSPNRLYFLNAARFHPLEKLIFQLPEVAPFIILGVNVETIALYFTFNSLHGLFQHSNVRLKLGLLNYIFSMTELHRWHHSQVIQQSDTNFGNNLIVWDLVFGTSYWPKDSEVSRIGLLSPDYPKDYVGQLSAPFADTDLSKPEDYVKSPETV